MKYIFILAIVLFGCKRPTQREYYQKKFDDYTDSILNNTRLFLGAIDADDDKAIDSLCIVGHRFVDSTSLYYTLMSR